MYSSQKGQLLAEQFILCRDGLVTYLCRQGTSADTAQDLISITGLKILQSKRFEFRQCGSTYGVPKSWVYKVALNTLRDYARKRRDIPFSEIEASDQQDGEAKAERIVSAELSPEAQVLAPIEEAEQATARAHILEVVRRGLDILSPEERVVLTHWQGKKDRPFLGTLKQTAVAQMMQAQGFAHASPASVSRYGERGWAKLRDFLYQEAAEDPNLRCWLRLWAA